MYCATYRISNAWEVGQQSRAALVSCANLLACALNPPTLHMRLPYSPNKTAHVLPMWGWFAAATCQLALTFAKTCASCAFDPQHLRVESCSLGTSLPQEKCALYNPLS